MVDEILVSALTRELAAAAESVSDVIVAEGYMPAGGYRPALLLPFRVAPFDVAMADRDRRSLLTLLQRLSEDKAAYLKKHAERAKRIHAAAARYDAVRARLKEAEANSTAEQP